LMQFEVYLDRFLAHHIVLLSRRARPLTRWLALRLSLLLTCGLATVVWAILPATPDAKPSANPLANPAGTPSVKASTGVQSSTQTSVPTSAPSSAPPSPPPVRAPDDFGFAEPYFQQIGHADAIPGSVVTALAQDARGWLWIGTYQGLIRYDGYHFRQFLHDDANPHSLAGDSISALWVGSDGRLWVGTHSAGLSVFDPEREQFYNVRNDPAQAADMAGGTVWALHGDAKGGVWIGTEQGLDYWPAGANTASVHYRHDPAKPNSLLDNRVRSLLLDRAARLWVGSASGLQRLRLDRSPGAAASTARSAGNLATGFETIASNPSNPGSLAGQEIRTLFQASDGKLWIGTREQGAAWLMPDARPEPGNHPYPQRDNLLHRLSADPLRPDRLSHGWVSQIAEPQPGQIWLGTFGGGINIVAAADGKVLRHLQHDPANASSLALNSIGGLLLDRSGLLWVGSFGGGLQQHWPGQQAFRLLRHSPGQPRGLSHPNVKSLLERADGTILIGSNGNGIDIIDRQRGLIGGHRPQPGQRGMLGDGTILALAETIDGSLWAGTQQAGVFRLPANSRQWQAYSTGDGLPDPLVRRLLVTRDGTLWAATNNGLARWHAGQQRFVALPQRDGSALRVSITAMAEDDAGRLWLGSNAGLWLKPAGQGHLLPIRHDPARPASLASDDVRGLLVDAAFKLWVASAKGLDRLQQWDGAQARFEHISDRAGSPGKNIGANLLQDRQGRIWSGEYVLDPQTLHLQELGKADGYDIGVNWWRAYTRTRDGLFLYGGTQGVAVVDPARFQPWAYQPQVQVTESKIDGKRVAPQALAPQLTLGPKQRGFSLEFSALDFSAPDKNHYAYRLEGYDPDWIETDSAHRSASYSNLPPGEYLFQVRGSNRLGQWSSQALTLPVLILPAFWQKGWFVALMLLLLALAARQAYRWRVARLLANAKALQNMVDLRTAEILAAHNELERSHQELESAHYDLQQTQQQLVLQEKMAGLGVLTAGVAHEINNPTNFAHVAAQNQRIGLQEFEQFLMALLPDDPDSAMVAEFRRRFATLQENVSTMMDGTERIKAIVRDLRVFTRVDQTEKHAVPLSECLNATLNLVRAGWLEKVEFITEYADDPPYPCWPALLNQVFMNLLVNACHAIAARQKNSDTRDKGHVWLRLRVEGDELLAEIADDGIGIPPEILPRILEPFFTTKEVGNGTGLGLSISYGIIEKHHGTLEIDSTPGQGSRFVLHLPLVPTAIT
jgi:signal transduction histidine kinase/ligand-binding sensor domain-containing protein